MIIYVLCDINSDSINKDVFYTRILASEQLVIYNKHRSVIDQAHILACDLKNKTIKRVS